LKFCGTVPDLAEGAAAARSPARLRRTNAEALRPDRRPPHQPVDRGGVLEKLKAIAAPRRSPHKLIEEIDRNRSAEARSANISSAIRVLILEHLTGLR